MDRDVVGQVVKFNSQTSGRDKLFRLFQYGSKFVWWYMQQGKLSPQVIKKLRNLEAACSTTRKLLRIGKSLDFLHGALDTIHLPDHVLRITLTMSKINQALYLIFDHIIWAGRVGLTDVDKQKWLDLSARFWLFSLILNLIRDVYDIWRAVIHELKVRDSQASRNLKVRNGFQDGGNLHHRQAVPSNREVLWKCYLENKAVFLDFIKNSCDLVLPMSSLGHINASPGVQGLFGLLSSIVGVATTWDPLLRLVPS